MLPCKCASSNICKEHLDEENEQDAFLECKRCETKVRKVLIKENYVLREKKEQCFYLTHEMREIKLSLDSKLDEIEVYLNQINETSLGEFSLKIYDQFDTLKNPIDIKREPVLENAIKSNAKPIRIDEIHRLSADFIKETELSMKKFLQNFNQEFKSLIEEICLDKEKKRLEIALRSLPLTVTELNQLKIDFESKLNTFLSNFKQIGLKLESRLQLNRFEEFLHSTTTQYMGTLYLNDFQYEYPTIYYKIANNDEETSEYDCKRFRMRFIDDSD